MKILVLKTWLKNIGNGFIDKGAVASIRQAFPRAEIIEASGHPNYVNDVEPTLQRQRNSTGIKSKFYQLLKTNENNNKSSTMVNIGELVDVDVAVLPGCVLHERALRKYRHTLENIRERSIPLIMLGSGGGDYQSTTVKKTKDILSNIGPSVMISRDKQAYKNYREVVELARNGIDCGFFINDRYSPPDANEEFIAATFDKTSEPNLNTVQKVIRPNHSPFPTYGNSIDVKYYKKHNTLISDCIEDYLFIYANADVTHADRIHACVPALTYGNKTKFYYSTPRASLFNNILEKNVSKSEVSVDQDKLKEKKSNQVNMIKEAIKKYT